MDKQEVINEIEKIDYQNLKYDSPERMLSAQKQLIIDIIERLDELQKVKVKPFIADWFEEHKDFLELSLGRITPDIRTKIVQGQALSEFEKWFNSTRNKPFETIIRMKNGYEIEQEQKWKIINDQKYCLTSIEAGYGNSLHWAFDSTKKKPILFDNEEAALYTAYITGGTVVKAWV